MFFSSVSSPPAERITMKSLPRQKGTRSLRLPTKFKKNAPHGGAQDEGVRLKRVPNASEPAYSSETRQRKTNAGYCHEAKGRSAKESNSAALLVTENFQPGFMISEDSSSSSLTSCLSLQSYSASTLSSAASTVPSPTGDKSSDPVEANSATERQMTSRSLSASSWMSSLSDAASLAGTSFLSDIFHGETATVPDKSSKTVRFNEVPQVHHIRSLKDRPADGLYAERYDETKALWHSAEEEIFMRQQPMDVLEDALRRAISMASDERSKRPPTKQRVCTFFEALLQELELQGNFTARGLESSVRDIATGQPSSALVDTVVAAVLMEQRRLRHDARTLPFDYDGNAMALAKASAQHSRRSREEALKLGHMDAMKEMEEAYSRLSSARESARVEEHDNTPREGVAAPRRRENQTVDRPTPYGLFRTKVENTSREELLLPTL